MLTEHRGGLFGQRPEPNPRRPSDVEPDTSKVQSLVEMGFSEEHAK